MHHGVVVPHVDHADDQSEVRGAAAQEADTVPERFPHGEACWTSTIAPLEPTVCHRGREPLRFSLLDSAKNTKGVRPVGDSLISSKKGS